MFMGNTTSISHHPFMFKQLWFQTKISIEEGEKARKRKQTDCYNNISYLAYFILWIKWLFVQCVHSTSFSLPPTLSPSLFIYAFSINGFGWKYLKVHIHRNIIIIPSKHLDLQSIYSHDIALTNSLLNPLILCLSSLTILLFLRYYNPVPPLPPTCIFYQIKIKKRLSSFVNFWSFDFWF